MTSPTKFTVGWRGYDRHQVDDFFEQIEEILDGAAQASKPITPDAFSAAGFDVVIRGYKPQQVHAAIDDARRRLGFKD